ncbi:putative membrane protein YccC [Enemella evansiae]|nr:putative membrane protein YccC [Enemella evansiae]
MSPGSHARAVLRFQRVSRRWPAALKTALAVAGPVFVAALLGRTEIGLVMSLGAFAVLYGPQTPGRFRFRLMSFAAIGLVLSALLGGVTAGHPVALLVVMVPLAALAAVACALLKVPPPGSYFFVLVCGVSGYLASSGVPLGQLVGLTAAGGAAAVLIGMIDLIWYPHRPERQAVAAAEEAVTRFEAAEPEEIRQVRPAASRALHHAWTTFRDSVGERPLSPAAEEVFERIGILQTRYTRRSAALVDPALGGSEAQPWGSVEGEESSAEAAVFEPDFESEQLRDSSLGRPDPTYLVRTGGRGPSEVWLIGARVGVATLLAGVLAMLVGASHPYWAVAFATLVLHQGGTRHAQTVRGLQRLLGTVLGLGLFGLVLWWQPGGVWLALLLFCLQVVVELLILRNYAAAVVFITPLALTIAAAGGGWAGGVSAMSERGLDTVLAVAVALLVLWLVGRGTALLFARAHARRCILATESVMRDLAESRYASAAARMNRRHLYYELLELEQQVNQSLADEPKRVRPYLEMFQAVATLGYLVLGACWHPQVRRAREAFGRATEPLQAIKAHPVTQPRSPEDIHADVLAVQNVITDWR